jgi:hypothetical protein
VGVAGEVVAVTDFETEPDPELEPDVLPDEPVAPIRAIAFATSRGMQSAAAFVPVAEQIGVDASPGQTSSLFLIEHEGIEPLAFGVAGFVMGVELHVSLSNVDVHVPTEPSELMPLFGSSSPFGAFFASQSVSVPPLVAKLEMTNR